MKGASVKVIIEVIFYFILGLRSQALTGQYLCTPKPAINIVDSNSLVSLFLFNHAQIK